MSIRTNGDPEVLQIAYDVVTQVTGRWPGSYLERDGENTRKPIPVLVRWCIFHLLVRSGWTQDMVASKTGKSRDTVQYGQAQAKKLIEQGNSIEALVLSECEKQFDIAMSESYFGRHADRHGANTPVGNTTRSPRETVGG